MTSADIAAVSARRGQVVPGDGLLHPVALAGIAVLVINDHILKAAWPGLVSGKLSDFAGLLFFPLFLRAAWEVGSLGRAGIGDRRVGLICIVATGVIFAAIKTLPDVAELYGVVLGWLQWVVTALPAMVAGGASGTPHRVSVVADQTDLIAITSLFVPYFVMKRRAEGVGRS